MTYLQNIFLYKLSPTLIISEIIWPWRKMDIPINGETRWKSSRTTFVGVVSTGGIVSPWSVKTVCMIFTHIVVRDAVMYEALLLISVWKQRSNWCSSNTILMPCVYWKRMQGISHLHHRNLTAISRQLKNLIISMRYYISVEGNTPISPGDNGQMHIRYFFFS